MSSPLQQLEPIRHQAFKVLFEARKVYLHGPIQDDTADVVVAQLMALDSVSHAPVELIINSPGGAITGMFAIHDTMTSMSSQVDTRCLGLAASAGAFLLATGTGERSASPNSRIMLHQPLGGVQGTARDIEIQAANMVWMRERINSILAESCGRNLDEVARDTDRDMWMTAEDALAYGVIDRITPSR